MKFPFLFKNGKSIYALAVFCVCCLFVNSGHTKEQLLSGFSLRVVALKPSVILREPVVFQAWLVNSNSNALVVNHLLSNPAAVFVYQLRDTNGVYQDVATNPEGGWMFCGNDHETNRVWQIAGQSTLNNRIWYPNNLPVGSYHFRAVFRIMSGELKGYEVESGEIGISVSSPTGADIAASDFWTQTNIFEKTHWWVPATSESLILNSGSHLQQHVDELFIANCSNSTFADYVRYKMTRYLSYRPVTDSAKVDLLEYLCEKSPRNFPMLTESYIALLETYKSRKDFQRMFTLGEKIKQNRANLPPEQWPGQLDQLLQEAAIKHE